MQVRITLLQASRSAGEVESTQYSLFRRRLTIGRGSTQDLQVLDAGAALRHATILPRDGQLQIEACDRCTFELNGVRRTKARLSEGDTVRIGKTSIRLQQAHPRAPLVLEVDAPADTPDPARLHTSTLRAAGLSARFWSWLAAISVIAIFALPPLSAAIYPPARPLVRSAVPLMGDRLWEAGPLHVSHQFIGNDCNACHVTPFQRVPNGRCTGCHSSVQHHVDVRSRDVALFREHRCGACHLEHGEPSVLVQRDPRLCTDCHAQIRSFKKNTSLVNVTDFGADHPDFHPAPEHSGLTFSHEEHLKAEGIKSPRGYEVLTCQSCHTPESSGRKMLPVRMDAHCARCHSLQFDENDPRAVVPHGNLPAVFDALEARFIREYLDSNATHHPAGPRRPGGEAQIMTQDQQRLARDWATRQALLVAGELLEKRVCVECHTVNRDPKATGYAQWRVEPVRLRQDWLPRAEFSHAAHSTKACKTCHGNASVSKSSSDLLLPGIQTCRQCHSGSHDSERLASDCQMCHRFHLPGRGLFETAPRDAPNFSATRNAP